MNKTTATSTKTVPLLHLLNQSRASAVRFEKDLLHLAAKNGSTVETVEATEISEVQLRKLPLLNRLTVLTKQGRTITVNGLDRNSSQALYTTLWVRVNELLNDEAAAKARALAPEIGRPAGNHHLPPHPRALYPTLPSPGSDGRRPAYGRAGG